MQVKVIKEIRDHLVVPADDTVQVPTDDGGFKAVHYKTKVIIGKKPEIDVGDIGTVVCERTSNKTKYYLVEFDKDINGHNGETGWTKLLPTETGGEGVCWWIDETFVKEVEDAKAEDLPF